MFYEFETLRGEILLVNSRKILLVGEDKKGALLIMDDGNLYALKQSYLEIKNVLSSIDDKMSQENCAFQP